MDEESSQGIRYHSRNYHFIQPRSEQDRRKDKSNDHEENQDYHWRDQNSIKDYEWKLQIQLYISRITIQSNAIEIISYKVWHERKSNLSHLRILGSMMYIHIPKKKCMKLDIHSHKRILINYEDMNQYKIWDLIRNDVVVSRDVIFIEGKSINQISAIYEKESRIVHESIMILSGSSEG